MNDRTLLWVGVGLTFATLVITIKMARGLQKVEADANALIGGVGGGPAGDFLSFITGKKRTA